MNQEYLHFNFSGVIIENQNKNCLYNCKNSEEQGSFKKLLETIHYPKTDTSSSSTNLEEKLENRKLYSYHKVPRPRALINKFKSALKKLFRRNETCTKKEEWKRMFEHLLQREEYQGRIMLISRYVIPCLDSSLYVLTELQKTTITTAFKRAARNVWLRSC